MDEYNWKLQISFNCEGKNQMHVCIIYDSSQKCTTSKNRKNKKYLSQHNNLTTQPCSFHSDLSQLSAQMIGQSTYFIQRNIKII